MARLYLPDGSDHFSVFTAKRLPCTQFSRIVVFSLKTLPVVMMKLASLPCSWLPTMPVTPSVAAGVVVSASSAFVSESPFSIAFLRLPMKADGLRRSAVVRQNFIPAFSTAAALVGASSQCFMSASDTNLASLGSSTSMAMG